MTETTEKTILAGGCCWGMQDLLRKRPGVISTRVGYTGANATYRHHGTHAEAIEIVFDPQQISYGRVYWLARRRSSRSSASVISTA
jgi:peptide-methionine (S)-S-oxide reductase